MDANFLMQKIAETRPDVHDYMMQAADELRDSPFRDEVVEEVRGLFEKVAFDWGGIGRHMGRAALGVGGTIAAGIGVNLATDAFDATRRGLTKSRDYKRMISENPDLQKHPMGAKSVQAIFSTLHRFNPEFAKDPYVAGTFVRNHLEMAGADKRQIDLGTLTNMVGARKDISDIMSRKIPIMPKPWDSPIDRKRKELEVQQLEGRVQMQPLEMQRARLDITRSQELTPLEKQWKMMQIELEPMKALRDVESHGAVMNKTRLEIERLERDRQMHPEKSRQLDLQIQQLEHGLKMAPGQEQIQAHQIGMQPGAAELQKHQLGMAPGAAELQKHQLGMAPGERELQESNRRMIPGHEVKLPLDIENVEGQIRERNRRDEYSEAMEHKRVGARARATLEEIRNRRK